MRMLLALLLAVGPAFGATAKLAWDASPSPGIAGYNLYRSTTSGSGYVKVNALLILTLPTDASPYLDNTVPSTGQRFYYVVRSVNVGGAESANSNEVPFVESPAAAPNLRIVP